MEVCYYDEIKVKFVCISLKKTDNKSILEKFQKKNVFDAQINIFYYFGYNTNASSLQIE